MIISYLPIPSDLALFLLRINLRRKMQTPTDTPLESMKTLRSKNVQENNLTSITLQHFLSTEHLESAETCSNTHSKNPSV